MLKTILLVLLVIGIVVEIGVSIAVSLLLRDQLRQIEAPERAETGRADRDRMNEGFENIMTYEVNGKTGFEFGDPGGE